MEKGKTAATPNSNNDENKSTAIQENETNNLKDQSSEDDKNNVDLEEGDNVEEEVNDSEELLPLDDHPHKDLHLSFEPTPGQLAPVKDIIDPKPLEETPMVDITKREELEELAKELKKEKEIGVNLQWSNHGYVPTTCLMTISTRENDYIIDAIVLKDDIALLNDIFLDTNIVKIFHAATKDLKWLQQEFNVFVINMFDTKRAMIALGHSLTKAGLDAALLEYKIEHDPTMVRVDFRKRPLPPKYKDHARIDSHFMIHIYEKLKNRLIEGKLLKKVLNQCNNECRVLHGEVHDAAFASIRKEVEQLRDCRMVALEKLNEWRHKIAEYIDINVDLVLSKHSMMYLALERPHNPESILKVCSKSAHVKERIQQIVDIMKETKPKFGPGEFRSRKRLRYVEKFGIINNYGESPKRLYYDDTSRGRGRGRARGIGRGGANGRPNEFYSRSSDAFAQNYWTSPYRGSRRGVRW